MRKIWLISIGYSVFGSLGFISLLYWFSMAAFHERYRYPYLYPLCITAGMLAFLACIAIVFINISAIKKQNKPFIKTTRTEILIILLSFAPFCFMWSFAIESIGKMF